MLRMCCTSTLGLAAITLVLLGTGRVAADDPCCPPSASSAAPVVTYYGPPPLYHPIQRLSYYLAQPVVYGPPPPVSYPAPATAVTTTRYGLFGRPWVSTTYYYPH
jgi:hypothetical protein